MDVCACPEANRSVPKSVAESLSERDRAGKIDVAHGSRGHLTTFDTATLRHAHGYLSQNLSLPCAAWYPELTDAEGGDACTVTELIDPATGLGDEIDGIFCKVLKGKHERNLPLIEIELPPDAPNHPVVEHYWDWFWHRQWRTKALIITLPTTITASSK